MLGWLLDTTGFVPRSHCGTWTPALIYTYQAANLMIGVAYLLIPFTLWVLWSQRRRELARPHVLVLFMAFITLCGVTHLTELTVFRWPAYRLYTLLYALTGVVSMSTALYLPGMVFEIIKLPSRADWHRLSNDLQYETVAARVVQAELKQQNEELARRLDQLQAVLETEGWTAEKALLLAQIKGMMQSRPGSGGSKDE